MRSLPLQNGTRPRIDACSTSGRCSKASVLITRRDAVCSFWAGALLASGLIAPRAADARPPTLNKEADAATSPYIQQLLKRSQDNKAKYDKERLAAYYKKNFKDYFEFEGGSGRTGRARGIKPDTQAAIDAWLQDNK